jgi:iron-sulfur cluster assembly protein
MITITDKAKSKIDHLMQDAAMDQHYFLRVSVKGGGCSGLSYNLDFDNEDCIRHEIFPLPGRHRA